MKMIMITGAMGGLGQAITKNLWSEGYSLWLTDYQTPSFAKKVIGKQNIFDRKNLQTLSYHQMDLTKSEAINKSVNLNLDIFKDWVGLVNNAGVSVGGNAYTQLLSEWDLMMSVNLTAPFLLSQKFILNAKNRQLTGSLVNIASMVGWVGAKKPGYAASKAGIMGLTKAFAMQVGPKIRVNAICPGAMATPMTADWNEDVRMKIIENTPIGRIAEPKEIAAVVSFLLNEQQSGYLTGSIINATGGQYLG